MGSLVKIYDDVVDVDGEAGPVEAIDGERIAAQLVAGQIEARVAAAALRCYAAEIALLRRDAAGTVRS